MKRLFICTGFSILLFVVSISKAGDIATESTQSATMGIIALLQQVTNEIMEIVEDIEELEATAGRLINQMSTALTDQIPLVGDIFDLLEDLEAIIEAGSGLAYSANNLETFMQDRFKSYDDYLTSIRADGGIVRANFETRFREWNNGHRDAIQSIMKAHGLHSDQLATEEDRLTKLENLSRNSEGRMQAAQIGHQIAIEEVKQMHKLRELLMEQSNLHASYFATKQAMDAETQAVTEYITEKTQVVPITDGAGY